MKEEWKIVEELDSFYSVSNIGRAKSHDRMIYDDMHKNGRHYKGKILSFNLTGKNEYNSIKYKGVKYDLHILVAKAFPKICGEWFEGCIVHHKDRDKTNNRADNLIVLSKEEHNAFHRTDTETKLKQRNAAIGRSGFWKGKRMPESLKKKFSEAGKKRCKNKPGFFTGHKHTEASRQKMSEARKRYFQEHNCTNKRLRDYRLKRLSIICHRQVRVVI